MQRALALMVVMVMALAVASGAHAASLSSLFSGGSITAGDKLFDNWQLVTYAAADPNRVFNADNIDVQAQNNGGLNPGPGLYFTASYNELILYTGINNDFLDLVFSFRVSSLDPYLKIKDASQGVFVGGLNWQPVQSYDLGMNITETFGTAPGRDDVSSLALEVREYRDPISGSWEIANLYNAVEFSPQSELWVTENIMLWTANASDVVDLSEFGMRFSQTQNPTVPEPSTWLLVGTGLAFLFRCGRRRKEK